MYQSGGHKAVCVLVDALRNFILAIVMIMISTYTQFIEGYPGTAPQNMLLTFNHLLSLM